MTIPITEFRNVHYSIVFIQQFDLKHVTRMYYYLCMVKSVVGKFTVTPLLSYIPSYF
jgi:hypothetical protein